MWMTIGTQRFAVTLEDNPTARAFVQLLPATFDMAELNGNEKHARLPRSLPTNAERPGTIRSRRCAAVRQRHAGGVLRNVPFQLQLHANRAHRRERRAGPGAGAGQPARHLHGAVTGPGRQTERKCI